ncbi:MAG: NADH-quinone oxidoreductase subunit M [Acidobacteria bacterium]|nr:NADH-quinone oxidoreductase subunit M [Acidobacteriota bacterium]
MRNLLNVVLFLPSVGALLLLFLPRRPSAIRIIALVFSLATFVLSLGLLAGFQASSAEMQFITDKAWIQSPTIRYYIGVDGISLFLVLLVTFLSVLCVLVSWRSVQEHVKEFFFFLLLLETGTIGVFLALDLLLFYVFWEVTLVPMYFLIGIWGHERRIYAAVKFFLYTSIGSLLMLVGIIWLHNVFGTFDYLSISHGIAIGALKLSYPQQFWLFLAFFVAFAIKVPLFPLHTWLPDAHVEAPTAGSVMLAGVLLKMGAYGMLRFCLPLFPDAAQHFAPAIIALAIFGIIYGALVSMVQPDLKKLIAYSSVSHLGFVVLGIFCFNEIAIAGALYQMINHGVSTGMLFLLVGMIYERSHTREISRMGGLATPAPALATYFLIASLSSIGLPLLNNFVGEFLILVGVKQARLLYTVLGATAAVLSAIYMLWMYQRVFLGETADHNKHMPDLNAREKLILFPAVALMVIMGIFSPYFLRRIDASTAAILNKGGLAPKQHVRINDTPHPFVGSPGTVSVPWVSKRMHSAHPSGDSERRP